MAGCFSVYFFPYCVFDCHLFFLGGFFLGRLFMASTVNRILLKSHRGWEHLNRASPAWFMSKPVIIWAVTLLAHTGQRSCSGFCLMW